jgi:hypothetical protein
MFSTSSSHLAGKNHEPRIWGGGGARGARRDGRLSSSSRSDASPGRRRFPSIELLAAPLLFSALSALAGNTVSPPAGFIRITIASNQQFLASLPFEPFDEGVSGALGIRLPGREGGAGDRVLKWDPVSLSYTGATRDATATNWVDGAGDPTSLTLVPGEGFWLVNRQPADQGLILAGEVVVDAERQAALAPALNLIGFPFSTAVDIEDTALAGVLQGDGVLTDAAGHVLTNVADRLLPGRGYWYTLQRELPAVWIEERPYGNAFPTNGEPPRIVGMRIGDDGLTMVLRILCETTTGERIDIFYQDIALDEDFNPLTGWRVAERGIPSDGQHEIEWVDRPQGGRLPVRLVPGRCYLVGRGDVDTDGDGVSDAYEAFVEVYEPTVAEPESTAPALPELEQTDAVVAPAWTDGLPKDVTDSLPWLQERVTQARPGDIISLAPGTYALSDSLVVDKAVVLRGEEGADATTLMGPATNSCVRLLHPDAALEGLTITRGSSPQGGGVYATGGALRDCTITGNAATGGSGGGVFADGPMTVERCVVDANAADFGGGIEAQGDLTVIDCVISGNEAHVDGGAVYAGAAVSISRSTIRDNRSGRNAGGCAISHRADLVLSECRIESNEAARGAGGGVHVKARGHLTLNACTVADNRAARAGPGIFGRASSVLLGAGNTLADANAIGGAR